MQTFRKISEPQPEDPVPKGPKPPLSYKTLIGNNFSQTSTTPNAPGTNTPPNADHSDQDIDHDELDDVDQLLDDALEESYR